MLIRVYVWALQFLESVMGVKFRCKHSGTVLEFVHQYDIDGLRQQKDDYEEVKEEPQEALKEVLKPPRKKTDE